MARCRECRGNVIVVGWFSGDGDASLFLKSYDVS